MHIDPILIVKIAFQTCIIIFISITFIAILFGQPEKLIRGFDPDGIACGADFGSRDYPYIYFSNPNTNTLHQQVCVKSCPKPDHKNNMPKQLECLPNSIVKQCQAKFSIDHPETQFLIYDILKWILFLIFFYTFLIDQQIKITTIFSILLYFSLQGKHLLTNTNDVYQNRWMLLIFILIAGFTSKQLLTQLKANTQYSVWALTFGLFIFVGTLGVIFVSQARDAILKDQL